MKILFLMPVALLLATGCNSPQNPTPATPSAAAQTTTAAPVKLTATQELAKYCRVCVLDKKEKMEEFLPTRLDAKYGGQTYKFCSDPCRKSFDANPAKYQLAKAVTR